MKKFWFFLLTSILIFNPMLLPSSEEAESKPAGTGPLRVHPTNPRYFSDGSGRAIYLTGSHTWNSLQDVTGAEWYMPNLLSTKGFEAYLDFLVDHGHNFIRLWIVEHAWNKENGARIELHPWSRTGPGEALDGKPRFDLSRFESVYFERLRARVLAARDRGIYVSVMLFGGMWSTEHSSTWKGHPMNAQNNINGIDGDPDRDGRGNEIYTLQLPQVLAVQKATATHVVETLDDLDNVLYEVANEVREYSTSWQYAIIEHFKQIEGRLPKQHPIGMTGYDSIPHEDLLDSQADWISPSNSGGDYRNNPPAADGRKVILVDTDHLWGEGGNPGWVWKSFTRGLQPIWMERIRVSTDDLPHAESIRASMGQTRRWAERMNLAAMTPQADLSSTGYCLAAEGAEYLVYQPAAGDSFSVQLKAGTYVREWFNPAADFVASSDTFTASSGAQEFQSPFEGEAVLYLKAVDQSGY